MKSVLLAIVACLFFISSPGLAADIEVSEIATKITDGPDSSGDVWFAIKATVRNNGTDEDVSIQLQAVDRDGFELNDVRLDGKISPGDSRNLTTKTYMPLAQYNQIHNWQVKN